MIAYDEFGFAIEDPADEEQVVDHTPIRELFPEAGVRYLGGLSNGWEYRTEFAGTQMKYTYEMIRQFLEEEGYGDIPIPKNVEELKRFKQPRQKQLQLFQEMGYIHNPIKILFPLGHRHRGTLILCIYNEKAPEHLVRFHGV
ncbi:MAG: hypothetical protein R2792_09485 [Saprospiraceae bacterium]